MSSRRSTAVPTHSGLSRLAERYDGFLVDLWGVLHDGERAFPAGLDCLARLKAAGKRVWILTNAPRRIAEVVARNRELGIVADHVDGVMSSGEAAWQHLAARPDDWYRALGRRCHHLGPERDLGMRAGLDYDFVDAPAAADFLLCTGALSQADGAADYDTLLRPALERDLPMVCANPDLEVIRGGRREICAGAIARRFESLGGRVRYHGKPHPGIYRACIDRFAIDRPERVAAIGDSLRTDIAGARTAGMDGIFVAGGIHAEALGLADGASLDQARLTALFESRGLFPAAALAELRW